ncbi:MAG TPA: hypothetical protein VGW38_10580 [Chloroflexota bacterium]|nr:hypothetical protein [Chloroflexota bacterium]
MPTFDRAQIATTTADLTDYTTFLRPLKVGQSVTLPLEPDETSRQVMRHLNAAAGEVHLRLQRLPSDEATVRFKVLPPEKRPVHLSEEAKRTRVEKAKATRAARQLPQAPVSLEATGRKAPTRPTVPEAPEEQPTQRRRRHARTRAVAPASSQEERRRAPPVDTYSG